MRTTPEPPASTPITAPETDPVVAMIVLNWNRTDLTLACLRSLYRMERLPDQVIVVDNGSHLDSPAPIADEFPQAILLCNDRNLGFAGGNNVAIRHALAHGADYLMLLNNDAEVAPDLLGLLVDFAESDAGIGIVGPMIYFYDDPERIAFAGGMVEPGSGRGRSLDSWNGDLIPRPVDWMSGCALLVKRTVVEEIGLLDERMFAYYEDIDWCARAHEAGWQVWLAPQARVWHKIEVEERLQSPWYVYLMTRNRLLFSRNRGATIWQLAQRAFGQDLRQALVWSLSSRYRGRRPLAPYKVRAVVDFMLGRFGEPPFAAGKRP